MEKKPLRVAAIIETTEGVLVVQDAKDKYRDFYKGKLEEKAAKSRGKKRAFATKRLEYARQILHGGRFSLPGGKIDPADYEVARATSIMEVEKPQTPEQIELYLQVIRVAIAREIEEELGLGVDEDMIKHIMEIQGRTRDHIICLVHAQGIVKINRAELSGIGLLKDKPAIPLNEYFYQAHLRTVHQKYILSPERQDYITRYLSKINISEQLVMDAYADERIGYEYASLAPHNRHKDRKPPQKPQSSPNFLIYDDKKRIYNPHEPDSFTDALTAKIVPPNPERKRAQLEKKKSDPFFKAVKPETEIAPTPANQPVSVHLLEGADPSQDDESPASHRMRKTATEALREAVNNPPTPATKVGKK